MLAITEVSPGQSLPGGSRSHPPQCIMELNATRGSSSSSQWLNAAAVINTHTPHPYPPPLERNEITGQGRVGSPGAASDHSLWGAFPIPRLVSTKLPTAAKVGPRLWVCYLD